MGAPTPSSLPTTGELPNPKTLEAYKAISPETLHAILAAFTSELTHQQKLTAEESDRKTKSLEAEIAFAWRGQVFGLVIGMTAIICGSALVYLGHEIAGGFIGSVGGGGVIGLVSAFIVKRIRRLEHTAKLATSESVAPVS